MLFLSDPILFIHWINKNFLRGEEDVTFANEIFYEESGQPEFNQPLKS